MDNLDFGNIAIGALIVGFLNLAIVILIKTETILKYIERIKSVIRLDYKARAKRSDDEIRIFKKHELVARERVRHSYVSTIMWNCKWTWNWSDEFEPINIKGYCLGDRKYDTYDGWLTFKCDHPVNPYYSFPVLKEGEQPPQSEFSQLAIQCSQEGYRPHRQTRAEFQILKTVSQTMNSSQAFESIIAKAILSERDKKIAREIQKLRLQFWR